VNAEWHNARFYALHLVSTAVFGQRPWRSSFFCITSQALMALTFKDIERVANLARLELRLDETERTLSQLNGFFALVEQMEAVNTDGVEPLAHPAALLGEVALRLRDDIASEPNQREASQASAPAVERGLFLVPKVIE
jgi:aspartyl-tRNA(Asn)/glutamyl-tRNA(Gln) amidotransferase subunit C